MHFSYMYIFVVHVLVVNFAPGDPPEFPDGWTGIKKVVSEPYGRRTPAKLPVL